MQDKIEPKAKSTAQTKADSAVQAAIMKAAQAQAKVLLAEIMEKRATDAQKRKDENRKKILAGAWVLSTMNEQELKAKLDGFLKRPEERALFNLPT